MMVITRSKKTVKSSIEQPSRDVASPGDGNSDPRRHHVPQQANAEVEGTNKDVGGSLGPFAGDHGVEDIKACMKPNCKLCPNFSAVDSFTSYATHRKYKVKNYDKEKKLSCNTDNLVYLITCDHCSCQYVGETSQQLNGRFNDHRYTFTHLNKGSNSTVLRDHFTTGLCNKKSFKVQIIETIKQPGQYSNGNMNKETAGLRKDREKYWMKELRTVYPYGLNNRCEKNMDQRTEDDTVYNILNKRRKKKSKHKSKHKTNKESLTAQYVFDMIKETSIKESTFYINKTLPQMNKKELKQLGQLLIDNEMTENCISPERIVNLVKDIIQHKLVQKNNQTWKNKRKKRISNPVIIRYENPAIDYINIQSILKLHDIKQSVSNYINDDITVVYQYTPTIRNKVFNYNTVIEDLDVDSWNVNNQNCECTTTFKKYMDTDHKHVITGDLSIIKNNKLRHLFEKGPNYRQRNSINFTKARKVIKTGLNKYIKKQGDRIGICYSVFNEWKVKIMDKVDEKIKSLRKGPLQKWRSVGNVLQDSHCSQELSELQQKFVITPIDKAGGNIALTCKPYYINNILRELNSDTYTRVESKDTIIKEQMEKNTLLKCSISDEDKRLPIIYAIVKMHKKPVKFRFIIAAKNVHQNK